MKKTLFSRALPVGVGCLVLILALAGCSPDGRPSDLGTVVLRVGASASARTFVPGNTTVTSYVVRGSGPVGQTPEWTFSAPQSQLKIEEIMAGNWRFTVTALNSDSKNVLRGHEDLHVIANRETSANVTISPIAGNGTLIIKVEWEPGVLNTPTFGAELRLMENGSFGNPVAIANDSFEMTGAGTARYSGAHPAGYYEVDVSFDDAAVNRDETTTVGARLMTDLVTEVTIEVEPGEGAASISIIEDLQSPLSVALDPSETVVKTQSASVTVTATVTGGSSTSYRWFINGNLQPGATGASFQLGPDLPLGRHTLSVVAHDSTALGSKWIGVDVVP